jgi:hypothetical protein
MSGYIVPSPSRSNNAIDSSGSLCKTDQCGAVIYCIYGKASAIPGIDAQIVGQPSKPTGDQGTAEFSPLTPPDKDYTAKVTFQGENLKKYVWCDTDDASTQLTQYIGNHNTEVFKFRAICLVRPRIQLRWKTHDKDNDKAVGAVGVKLKQADAEKFTLSDTDADEGIAKLADADKGVKPGDYTVAFPTGLDLDLCTVEEPLDITIGDASPDPFLFHIIKFYVGFQIKDQFDEPVSDLQWVLHYPDGKKKESGTLKDDDPEVGIVKKDPVPDGTYKFAVKLVFNPTWEFKDLEIDKEVKLSVSATGFDPDTEIKFEIFDSCVLSGDALDSVTDKTAADIDNPAVTVTWKPDAVKLEKVTSGAVVFVASVDTFKTFSDAAPISGKRTFDVKGPDDAPLETTVDFNFSGGGRVTKKSERSKGGKAEPMVPLGATLLSVQLGRKHRRLAKFTDSSPYSQSFVVPSKP